MEVVRTTLREKMKKEDLVCLNTQGSVDFGTLSGRALLVNVETGEELATAYMNIPMLLWMKTYLVVRS